MRRKKLQSSLIKFSTTFFYLLISLMFFKHVNYSKKVTFVIKKVQQLNHFSYLSKLADGKNEVENGQKKRERHEQLNFFN